jgi:ubiquinone/menaquinone biosynthesis C-methylase UbiE
VKKISMLTILIVIVAMVNVPEANALQLAGRSATDWIERLERPDRVATLRIDDVLARLDLKPGMIVADLGAGTGLFARPIARKVAPTGKVYAVDVEQGLVDHIAKRAKEEQISNLHAVLGKFDDPTLPSRDIDLAFFHDVLHHIEKRETYLKALSNYMKPNSRIALIELDAERGGHRDDAALQLRRPEVDRFMANAGFYPVQEVNLYKPEEGKWFVIYGRKVR